MSCPQVWNIEKEEKERDREKEKVGRQTSEAKLNEKKSYSEKEKTKETFFWRNNMNFVAVMRK